MTRVTNLVHGLHAVQAALRRSATAVNGVWVDDSRRDARMQEILTLAQQAKVTVHTVTRQQLDAMAEGAPHQGVVAQCGQAKAHTEDDLDAILTTLTAPPFLLVLDGVQDPHNLGACLRSADAAGVHTVIAPRDKSVSLTPTVRKVASGAAESVPFIQVTNLARTLRSLRDAGVWLIGADGTADTTLYDADLKGPLALVMGGEGQGLRRLTREHCDVLIRIPMHGSVESLNVSVATGICLYEAVRQRTNVTQESGS